MECFKKSIFIQTNGTNLVGSAARVEVVEEAALARGAQRLARRRVLHKEYRVDQVPVLEGALFRSRPHLWQGRGGGAAENHHGHEDRPHLQH